MGALTIQRLLWRYAKVVAGLDALMQTLDTNGATGEVGKELTAWQKMRQDHPEAFVILNEEAERRHNKAYDRYMRFPSGAVLAPTKLGNAQERVEDYCLVRYRIPSYTLWNRLTPLLDASDLEQIARHKQTAEALVNTALVLVVLTLLGIAGFSQQSENAILGPWQFVTVGIVLPAIASYLMYSWAVMQITQMGDLMTGVIDAHRRKVLEAFGLKDISSFSKEREYFHALSWLFSNGESGPLEALTEETPQASDRPV
ncbi:MAG: hypothetical protein HUJ31_11950 [Pseudomonadales bacterium]|nr:hypothetical protein [Pseudomonadales bacterium]